MVETIRQGDIDGTITYSQAELAPLAVTSPRLQDQLESAMALLALVDAPKYAG